ncbi:MAG TPA: transketolase C-terminal domain-containing protein [Bacillota bacterium]|jgi:transketolase|nr:transketolase C-terminal domain-containing protein [Bacillota bacterium]
MTSLTMRDAYAQALVALGERNENVVVLDADTSRSTRSMCFGTKFPERFFNVGIAEANMMSIAGGLAASGKIPFVNVFSFLATLRAGDQLRTGIAYPRLNVKIAGAYSGLSNSYDGPTHQDVSDISVVRSIPNMVVISVSDAIQVRKVVDAVAKYEGPVYFRLNRNAVPVVSKETDPFTIGQAIQHYAGSDATIIATGIMVSKALQARTSLKSEGISVGVLEIHTIKPLDEQAILEVAMKTGATVTAEEHSIYGGLGSAVAEVLSEHYPAPMERVGIRDVFAESGAYEALLEKYGLSPQAIVEAVRKVLKKKSQSE